MPAKLFNILRTITKRRKYIDVFNEISYDNGESWYVTSSSSTLIEENSADCGYRTRVVSDDLDCEGDDLVGELVNEVSYIKNGKKVKSYAGASLPIGILAELEGFQASFTLQEDDLLIMMSDGLYELNEPPVFQWEKIIASLPTENPQLAAEYLLAIATSRSGKVAQDDLTVVVSRLIK